MARTASFGAKLARTVRAIASAALATPQQVAATAAAAAALGAAERWQAHKIGSGTFDPLRGIERRWAQTKLGYVAAGTVRGTRDRLPYLRTGRPRVGPGSKAHRE